MNKLKNFVILLLAILLFHSFSSKIYEKFTSEEIKKESKKIKIPLPIEQKNSEGNFEKKNSLNDSIVPFLNYDESPISEKNIENQDTEIDVNINDVLADSFNEDFSKSTELNLDLDDNKIKYQLPDNEKKVRDAIEKSDEIKKIMQEPVEPKKESCGPGLIPRKIEGKLFCESNAVNNWKLNKPVSKVLDKITKCTPENAPKAVKDIYNKIVNPPKRHLDNVEIQGSYTMNNNNNKWLNLKVESKKPTKLTESLFANDPDFDSFSRF